MSKKTISVVTLILVVVLGIFLWSVNRQESEQTKKYAQMDEVRRPLLVKKREIEQQIADLEKEYEADRAPKGTTQLLFTGLEADVYNICYPIMKEYEYTGTLALSLTQLPGMEGRMSVEQFQELMDEGWDICIKWDAEAPVNNWWPNLQRQIRQLGLETGSVVYFTTGTYTKTLDAQLQKMGFSVVVHHGEESASLVQLNDEEGIWHLGAVGMMGEGPQQRLTEAISKKGNITYLIGFELEDERYDERSFHLMMGYFDAYEANQELIVTDTETAREHYRNRLKVYEEAKQAAYKQARDALEAELTAVEKELQELDIK